MRKLLAIWSGKLLTVAGRLIGKKSSSSPGEYALRIYPKLVADLRKHIKKGIIVTCGTNGKTTTNNLLCSALEAKGYKVICNRLGANMLNGVATTYLQAANLLGDFEADYACLEIDEAYTRIVFDYIKPDVMVITNLFRDQLDRYGEIDITTAILKEAIAKVPGMKLVLNADDPLCVRFKEETGKALFYGISEKVLEQLDDTKEGRFCPMCGAQMGFKYYHYSQLGDFECKKCGFKRPRPDVEVKNVSLKSPMSFTVNGRPMKINYKGFYNIYNLIAVYAAMEALGESTKDFASLLGNYKPQIGRMQEFAFKKPVILSLSKNPAGFNQAIATVNTDDRKKDVIIAINDLANDGRDVSWLWDVDFDKIYNENLNTLTTTGIRMWDISLRFKYSDVKVDYMEASMKKAVKTALESDSEVVYVLVNYTALYPTEAVLNELLKEGRYNAD
ncbi:MAG: MurT ligase domain-containing protein [Clostridiales bacterium]|nr:MurT ligase domain-containing protein [Clostridiales bacterium]